MRKKNFKSHCTSIGWTILQFLPLIFFIFGLLFECLNYQQTGTLFSVQGNRFAFENVLESFHFHCVILFEENLIFQAIMEITLYFFPPESLNMFIAVPLVTLSWYITVFLLRLCMDFILFIPRLAHKWLHSAYGGDDYE